jgi:hypothetical protein
VLAHRVRIPLRAPTVPTPPTISCAMGTEGTRGKAAEQPTDGKRGVDESSLDDGEDVAQRRINISAVGSI